MADQKTIQINFKAISDFKGVIDGVKQIQNVISQLKLTPTLEANFKKVFSDVESYGQKAAAALQSGFKTKGDVNTYAKNLNAVTAALEKIQSNINKIDGKILEDSFKNNIDTVKLKELNQETAKLKTELGQMRSNNLEQIGAALKNIENISKAGSWGKFKEAFEADDIEGMKKAITALNTGFERYSSNTKNSEEDIKRYGDSLETLDKIFQKVIDATSEFANKMQRLAEIDLEKGALSTEAVERGTEAIKEASKATGELINKNKELTNSDVEAAKGTQQLNSELDQIKNRIQYFFGLNNAVRLFQQAIRSAFNTIKDLDKVMTETAVVTSFDVGDMWSQLPEYTKRANELGISIHDAYEAATLYYQQGLKTNEVMAVSNETLKMARIAGLDAAEATDRMTNALRGFNMEITETNAQNINDVYSNLAAKTASNVDEISTAMTKVASLANNANMSFENTAAFLSQIIETTRESAETAGTALKTVIARFSEVKSLYSKGELLGEVEGEEIDVNKVSKALRTAGINLNEYLTGAKGLDQIFIELSAKWDSLDQVQQRYIATMAAGSRQQSRFIALMQDNARMTELVREANNATGASQEQFEKTLDSLESKLNQLKNAWDTFLMGLANDEAIKAVIDLLTQIITLINKATSGLPGLLGSFSKLAFAFGAFKIGKGILNKGIFSSIGKSINGEAKKAGTEAANSWGASFRNGIKANGGGISGAIKSIFTKTLEDGPKYTRDLKSQLNKILNTGINVDLDRSQRKKIAITYETEGYEPAKREIEEMKGSLDGLNKEAQDWTGTHRQVELSLDAIGTAAMVAGSAISLLSQAFDDGTEEGKKTAETMAKVGSVVTGVGAAITTIGGLTKTLGISISTTASATGKSVAAAGGVAQVGWGWIGAIAAVAAGLAIATIAIVKSARDAKPENQLKKAKEAANEAKEAANDAKEAYENLGSSLEGLRDKYKVIEDLTAGTREWRDAVQEVNFQILELIDKYPELASFIKNEGGVLKLDIDSEGVQGVIQQYFNESLYASSRAAGANLGVIRQEEDIGFDKIRKFIAKEFISRNLVGGEHRTTSPLTDADKGNIDNLARFLAGDLNALGEKYSNQPVSDFTDFDNLIAKNIKSILGSEYFIASTQEAYDTLKEYGLELINNSKRREGNYDIIANNALAGANIPAKFTTQVSNFGTGNLAERLTEQDKKWWREYGSYKNLKKKDSVAAEVFEKYWEDKGGTVKPSGKVKLDGKTISAKDAYDQFVKEHSAEEGQRQLGVLDEAFGNYLKTNPYFQRLYSDTSGKGMLAGEAKGFEDIDKDKLPNELISALGDISDDVKDEIVKQINATGNAAKEANAAVNERIKTMGLYSGIAGGVYGKPALFSEVTIGTKEEFFNNLAPLYSEQGKEVARGLVNSIATVIEENGIDPEQFISRINETDWNDINSVNDFIDGLKELGVNIDYTDESFIGLLDQLKNLSTAANKVNLENLTTQILSLNSIISKLNKGELDRVWSKEDYEQLRKGVVGTESEDILSDFVMDENGNYIYLGQSMDRLREALITSADKISQSGEESIREQIKVKNSGALVGLKDFDLKGASEEDKNRIVTALLKSLEGYDLDALGIEGLTNESTAESIIRSGMTTKILTALQNLANDNTLETKLQDYSDTTKFSSYYNRNSLQENAQAAMTDPYAMQAFKAQVVQSGIDMDYFGQYYKALDDADEATRVLAASQLVLVDNAYKEAEAFGLDTTELIGYAKELQQSNKHLKDNPALAMAVATSNKRLNVGLKEIVDSYGDWNKLIKNGKVSITNSEDAASFEKLKKSVQKMLGVTGDLSDEFWENEEVLNAVKAAAEGDVSALKVLQKQAALDYVINIDVDETNTKATNAIKGIAALIRDTDLPSLEPGVELQGYDKFIAQLNELIKDSGLTADQINTIFDSLGFDVELGTKSLTTYSDYEEVIMDPPSFDPREGRGKRGEVRRQKIRVPNTVQVPYIKSITSSGSGGKGIHPDTVNAGNNNKNGGKSSSSGGGGGSSTPSYWKNPYDELYNLQEKINEALREREALERRYQKLLKDQSTTVEQVRKGYYDQINALREEIRLQQQLQSGRRNQIQNLGSQLYTDENGRQRTFSSMGVTRYARYDFESGRIIIDWEALEAISHDASRTEEGEAAEAYINLLQELVSSYEETRDAIWDIEDRIEDLIKEAVDSYISFEDRVKEALIAHYEKQINTLEVMNESINEATAKVIDSIQEQINAQRQERSNQKTEESIAEKEARLAYLRRDTSGSNELEILQLEKELEEARQNYEDNLIDQAIEQMRKDADLAAEQRAKQIEIMRAQLQVAIDEGTIWQEVYDLINSATDENGQLDFNSELIRLLKEAEAFDALSAFGSDEWIKALGEEFRKAIEGLAAGGADYAGQHQGEGEGGGAGASSGGSGGSSGGSNENEAPAPDYPYGKVSELTRTYKKGMEDDDVMAIQYALNRLGFTDNDGKSLVIDGKFGPRTDQAVRKFQRERKIQIDGIVGPITRSHFGMAGYKTGGLADFTGPAWLDGTKSNPELVLNADDTRNFITLRNVLSQLLNRNGTEDQTVKNAYFNIDINADISSEYDVRQLADQLKEEIVRSSSYRNVNVVNFIR